MGSTFAATPALFATGLVVVTPVCVLCLSSIFSILKGHDMYKNKEQPATRAAAILEKQAVYLRPPELGKFCEHDHCAHLYTETQECVVCTRDALWETAKANPDTHPLSTESALALGLEYTLNGQACFNGPHLLASPINGGKCFTCSDKKRNSPRQKAMAANELKYMPLEPCAKCQTMSLKRVDNGACDGCAAAAKASRTLSARMTAKLAGERWYIPEVPCPYCLTVAKKRVDNGHCLGCNPPKRGHDHISDSTRAVMDNVAPGFILEKSTAVTTGLTAYRDGKFCPEGHTGWKYISGGCVTCGGDACVNTTIT